LTGAESGSGAVGRGGAPETVGQILPRVLRESGFTKSRRASTMADLWERAAGPELAAETRPSTLRQGVLTIEVRSAGLLAELAGFRTQELLSKFLAEDPSGRVVQLRFRLGVF
jgi:predicted nucleic acid-binding Zn ribbon protein